MNEMGNSKKSVKENFCKLGNVHFSKWHTYIL